MENRKGISKTPIVLTTLLATLLIVAGLNIQAIFASPAVVGSISSSHTRFYEKAVVAITITDPDIMPTSPSEAASLCPTVLVNNVAIDDDYIYYFREERVWRIFISVTNDTYKLPSPYDRYTVFCGNGTQINTANPLKVYKVSVSLGETVTVIYRDFTAPEPPRDVSVVLTYTSVTATVETDRPGGYIPPGGKFKILIRDSDWNRDPLKADSYTITKEFIDVYVNDQFSGKIPSDDVTANETGVSTGVFVAQLQLPSIPSLKNGDLLTFKYDDPETDVEVSWDMRVKVEAGVLSVEPVKISTSGEATIKLTDFDRNVNPYGAESLPQAVGATLYVGGDKKGSVKANVGESGKDTGVFTVKIYVSLGSSDSISTDASGNIKVTLAPENVSRAMVRLNYTDTNPQAAESEALLTFTTTPATVSFEKASYLPTDTNIVLILSDPDINDLPTSFDSITLTTNGVQYNDIANCIVGVFKEAWFIFADGTKKNVLGVLTSGVFYETDKDTGKFKIQISMSTLQSTLGASSINELVGGRLYVKYYDAFDGTYAEASTSIGGTLATIEVEPLELPIPGDPSKQVLVYVTVKDPDRNLNPMARDSFNIYVDVINATGHRVDSIPVSVIETGVNTSIFQTTVSYTFSSNQLNVAGRPFNNGWRFINGKLVFKVEDPLATTGYVTVERVFRAYTASLSVEPSAVKMGDSFNVTVVDRDYNLDIKSKDKVGIKVSVGTWQATFDLYETDVNSGVFKGTIKVDPSVLTGVKPLDVIKISFKDDATAASYYTLQKLVDEEFTVEVKVLAHTAKLWTDSTVYSPYAVMKVYVYDPDLVFKDASQVQLSLVKAVKSGEELRNIVASKAYGNGTFEFTITLNTDILVSPLDTIYVYFLDDVSATGAARVVSVTASVKSETGIVELDKSAYIPGEYVTIRVKDIDRNKNNGAIETVSVTVMTTSYPVGLTINVPETGANTGVFEVKVKLVALEDWTPGAPGQVPVEVGDTITVRYVDPMNATGKEMAVEAKALVGALIKYPVPATQPKLVDPATGRPVDTVVAGRMVSISSTIENKDIIERKFVFMVQVKDAQGVVVKLDWISGAISAGATMTPALSWTPAAPGSYIVEIYVVESLAAPEPLSPAQTLLVTVS